MKLVGVCCIGWVTGFFIGKVPPEALFPAVVLGSIIVFTTHSMYVDSHDI